MPRLSLCLVALLLAGCAGDLQDPPKTTSDGDPVVTGSDAGWAAPGGESGTAASTLPPQACKRVDLVIAVDDSGSMTEEMQAMRSQVFPAFATALLKIGGGLEDYRVAVLDACPTPATYHTRGNVGECAFESQQVWMDSSSTDLVGEFQCVGDIYSGDAQCSGKNDDEQPASAALAALSAPYAAGENAGFLRDDALLVVIAITDEDEQPVPAATDAELYNKLVGIKGDVRKMVFLGIGGSQDCQGVYGQAKQAQQLKALTDRFTTEKRGVFWDLCQGKLEDGLTAAMKVIEEACNDLPLIE